MVTPDQWPYAEPPNCATFVTAQVLDGREPIRLAVHDEDHEWQFIGSTEGSLEDAKIILLSEAVALDPSVLHVADLPVGWRARRESPEEPWTREVDPDATQTI